VPFNRHDSVEYHADVWTDQPISHFCGMFI